MTAAKQLQGTDLIDCAKANAKSGLETAAKQCGYDDRVDVFQANLMKACEDIGVSIDRLEDLITDREVKKVAQGIEIAPETNSNL
ncbi:MAG: hypothetical protein ACFBSE_09400 [Prochloraceae cyanobacterium]